MKAKMKSISIIILAAIFILVLLIMVSNNIGTEIEEKTSIPS